MTSLSDTLTVGLVLVLLFGSIALYLYTRLQQAEQKISLLESILLDLKMSAEIKSYSELPAVDNRQLNNQNDYTLFEEYDNTSINITNKPSTDVSSSCSTDNTQTTVIINEDIDDMDNNMTDTPVVPAAALAVNYESMTLKELQTLAKTRGITGANSMKKGSIIEALKTSDRSSTSLESSHIFADSSSSFIDTSSPV